MTFREKMKIKMLLKTKKSIKMVELPTNGEIIGINIGEIW